MIFSLNSFVLLINTLATLEVSNSTHYCGPCFHTFMEEDQEKTRDVLQTLQLNPVIVWYMIGNTAESLDAVVEKICRKVLSPKTLALNDVNR